MLMFTHDHAHDDGWAYNKERFAECLQARSHICKKSRYNIEFNFQQNMSYANIYSKDRISTGTADKTVDICLPGFVQ